MSWIKRYIEILRDLGYDIINPESPEVPDHIIEQALNLINEEKKSFQNKNNVLNHDRTTN